jgi:hypothetical protein
MLVEEELASWLEDISYEQPKGAFWSRNSAKGENRYEGIDRLGCTIEGRELRGVLGAIWEDEEGPCRFGETCSVCESANVWVHEHVWLEGDVFSDFIGTEVIYGVTMA